MGTPTTYLTIPLGTWWGKPRSFKVAISGKPGLTASQLNEWFAYEQIEPYGEFRSELRHGQLMALHANINRDSKARSNPFDAFEFMNFFKKPAERVYTPEELEAYAEKIFGK